jgi:hypothetical protein
MTTNSPTLVPGVIGRKMMAISRRSPPASVSSGSFASNGAMDSSKTVRSPRAVFNRTSDARE